MTRQFIENQLNELFHNIKLILKAIYDNDIWKGQYKNSMYILTVIIQKSIRIWIQMKSSVHNMTEVYYGCETCIMLAPLDIIMIQPKNVNYTLQMNRL